WTRRTWRSEPSTRARWIGDRGSGFPDEHTFGEFPDEAGGIAGWGLGELLDRDAVLRRNSLTAHTPGEPRKHFHSNGRNQQYPQKASRSEEHTSELQSRGHLVCRLLLEKKK